MATTPVVIGEATVDELHERLGQEAILALEGRGTTVAPDRVSDAKVYAREGYLILLEAARFDPYTYAPTMAREAVREFIELRLEGKNAETSPQYLSARKRWRKRAAGLFHLGDRLREEQEDAVRDNAATA